MKSLICFAAAALTIVSCTQEPKDYVSFSGQILNQNSDSLIIGSNTDRDFKKRISVSQDGSFSDTLKIVNGAYYVFYGSESTSLYLKNSDDIKLTLDTKEFDETVVYTGIGAEVNNYLAQKSLSREAVFEDKESFLLSKEEYAITLETIESDFMNALGDLPGMDTAFVAGEKKDFAGFKNYLVSFQEQQFFLNTVLAKGTVSPKFVGYENNAGGETSLDDLKGKYVYVDVWATWCGPCKAEIPFLKEVEKTYHDKMIEFVSLSVDDPKDYDIWKSMIKDKELGGIQLFADKSWKSDFVVDYKINGIPRFILIDPEGNIISPDAPRPSDDKLEEIFASLSI
ncbi:MAG: thiol-disulfide isomerase/thioredoxin [Cryomorphaceae bacterium]|jgi:thiol-disulfide isomerase/thioredoxin